MPELHFKGKEYAFNHHLTVPHRPLVAHPDKSVMAEPVDGERDSDGVDGNLIIHGDNLHALKALLPRYAGKVDCIFIDPPYNTGHENWNYNDNVNSPIMQEWLDGNPVNKEDMLRHDKWCCMMYPRLKLLHELLSEDGSFWMTLDDCEIHRARNLLDEIFGEENFISLVTWQKKVSPANDAKWFSNDNDFLIVYAKSKIDWRPNRIARNENQTTYYTNPDNDPRGDWNSSTYTCNKSKDERPNLYYPIVNPNTGEDVWPEETAVWQYSKDVYERHENEGSIYWGKDGKAKAPRIKKYLDDVGDIVPRTIWSYREVGSTQEATTEFQKIFPNQTFISPKPVRLLRRVLDLATNRLRKNP